MHNRSSKRRGLLALVAVAVVAVVIAGCGSSDNSSSSSSTSGGANKNVKVAVLSTGAVNNRSWANSWADGAAKAPCGQPGVHRHGTMNPATDPLPG